ncbi:MAG: hypothetical protein ABSC94_31120 [Polyangiaceae bacterium]|jgi:hypothetical protein
MALPFFRTVCGAEFADWHKTGKLGPGPSGMEGKHLWSCYEHAEAFGRLLQQGLDPAEFHVLEVQFSPGADVPCYNQRQDGIGPAHFADEEALKFVSKIRKVVTIPKREPEQNA